MESQVESLLKLAKNRGKRSSSNVISFVSGKGGVGKTAITTSLAYSLANHFNKRVLLLDCDMGLGNVHVVLGLSLGKSLKSVFQGVSIKEVVQRVYNFDVVLGFSGIERLDELEEIEASSFLVQLEKMAKDYDYILLDNSAGLNRYTLNFSRASSSTYVITTPEPTSLTDAYAFIKSLYKLYSYRDFKVIVNMVSSKREGIEVFDRLNYSVNRFLGFKLKLVGVLPHTEKLKESLLKETPFLKLYPSDPFSREIKRIAQLEVGEVYKGEEEKGSFIKRIVKLLFEGK
ncbi:MinD/ParA family protein [Thermovibrio sp.]